MKLADLMRHIPEDLSEGLRIKRRAIGRDAYKGQVACRQGRFQTPQKRPDVLVGGIVIQDVIEEALVSAYPKLILYLSPKSLITPSTY